MAVELRCVPMRTVIRKSFCNLGFGSEAHDSSNIGRYDNETRISPFKSMPTENLKI